MLRSFGLVMEPDAHQVELTEDERMRLTDYLDKGASLDPAAPCLTMAGRTLSYADVQRLSWRSAGRWTAPGIRPGDKVAILSGNDPVAFGCVFGISRAGRGLVPGQPAQRGGREPRAAGPASTAAA